MAWWDDLKYMLETAWPPSPMGADTGLRGAKPRMTAFEYPTTDPNILAMGFGGIGETGVGSRIASAVGAPAPGVALAPSVFATWKNLIPPKGLKKGGSLAEEFKKLTQRFREERANKNFTEAAETVQNEFGLSDLGSGYFKKVYTFPTQESQEMAVALSGKHSSGATQNQDIAWPGHVKGVVPIWWYPKDVPRHEATVFAMPKIDIESQWKGPSQYTGEYWYGPHQNLDLVEIAEKLRLRGLKPTDLHSGNVVPEFSEALGRDRAVLLDRGGIYSTVHDPYSNKALDLLKYGNASMWSAQPQTEAQMAEAFLTGGAEQVWPNIAKMIARGEWNPHSISVPPGVPAVIPPQPGATPPPVLPTFLANAPMVALTPPATPPNAFWPSGKSEEVLSALLRDVRGMRTPGSSVPIPGEGGVIPTGELGRIINLKNRVADRLNEFIAENPSNINTAADAARRLWPLHSEPWWRNLFQSRVPQGQNVLIQPPSRASGEQVVRDLAMERMLRRGQLPSWLKVHNPAGEPVSPTTAAGPRDAWDRILDIVGSPMSSDPFYRGWE